MRRESTWHSPILSPKQGWHVASSHLYRNPLAVVTINSPDGTGINKLPKQMPKSFCCCMAEKAKTQSFTVFHIVE